LRAFSCAAYPFQKRKYAGVQYLERCLASDTCCAILAVAIQFDLEELAAQACTLIISQISAATCPPQLVLDTYSLDYYSFVHLLRVANETVPVRLILGRVMRLADCRADHAHMTGVYRFAHLYDLFMCSAP
jgi:hypothetical protein